MTLPIAEPTALYRLYGQDGVLLYVGITKNIRVRFAHHARNKDWWPQVDRGRTRIVWLDDRPTAEAAELEAIRDERPVHNIITSDDSGCARFLPASTGKAWGRPRWSPSPKQAARVDAVVGLYRQKERMKAEYKALLAGLANPSGDDVPVAHLAARLGVERKTIYRHIDQSPS